MNGGMKSLTSQEFENSVITMVEDAKNSAAGLVNILADRFPCFRDEHTFEKRKVRILKRAQILVADLWAAFEGEGYGEFNDMNKITIFAGKQKKRYCAFYADNIQDYRIPQILHSLGCLIYCPPLESRIRRLDPLESGHSWEIQLRGMHSPFSIT